MKNFSLNSNIFSKYLLSFLILIILFCAFLFVSAYSYVNAVSTNVESCVFRFHVLANSDSEDDQNLKLLVRDAILDYTNTLIDSSMDKAKVIQKLEENMDILYEISNNVIKENGYNYSVKISIGNFLFPQKNYGDITLPTGYYDGLRIEIGEAKGHNWWCVMFPPLCFVDVTSGIVPDESKEIMKNNMESEEYNLISGDSVDMKFKFKIVELFNSSPLLTAKH